VFVRLGWLELRFLEIEGNPIAVEYGFRYGGKVYGYQLGFDPAFSRLGPGTVLLGMRVQQLITEGYRELDMLRGSGAYKYHWTKVDRENHNYVIPRPGVRGLTSYTQDLLALPPALLLKRVAPVTAFEKMRDVWARVRGRKPPPRNPGHHTRTRSSKGTRAGQE
jgi:CelD/BcsL family acetyltransferase involved in cellulose biosynthesis